MRGRDTRRGRQLSLPLKTWGGARKGAGRKRASGRASTPHRARPEHNGAHPLHVTLRAGLRPLRSQYVFPTVRRAIALASSESFRVVQFSVQDDHLHLIVEAADKRALSNGMRGLVIRIARQMNKLLMRRGRLWADRWHARALTSPRQVRNALVYVLCNFRKHSRHAPARGGDPFSSAPYFDGWRDATSIESPPRGLSPPASRSELSEACVRAPQTWLARTGWRRHGLIGLEEAPR